MKQVKRSPTKNLKPSAESAHMVARSVPMARFFSLLSSNDRPRRWSGLSVQGCGGGLEMEEPEEFSVPVIKVIDLGGHIKE